MRGTATSSTDTILAFMLSFLSELLVYGVGFHHAGMDAADRKTVEAMFTAGDLPVLCKPQAAVCSFLMLNCVLHFLQSPQALWPWV